jgi:hypothetical protein
MAEARLVRGPAGPEMLLAARAAEEIPRQERDLVAGLDLVPDMVPDRAAQEALLEDPFLVAHYPPLFEQLGA